MAGVEAVDVGVVDEAEVVVVVEVARFRVDRPDLHSSDGATRLVMICIETRV